MDTIVDIKTALQEETTSIKEEIKKEDQIIDDESLDNAIFCRDIINTTNEGYIRLFDIFDKLSVIETQDKEDIKLVKELIKILKALNRQAISMWIDLDSDKFLKIACKSSLLDLRVNIRIMKEYIDGVSNKFILRTLDTPEMDELFESF